MPRERSIIITGVEDLGERVFFRVFSTRSRLRGGMVRDLAGGWTFLRTAFPFVDDEERILGLRGTMYDHRLLNLPVDRIDDLERACEDFNDNRRREGMFKTLLKLKLRMPAVKISFRGPATEVDVSHVIYKGQRYGPPTFRFPQGRSKITIPCDFIDNFLEAIGASSLDEARSVPRVNLTMEEEFFLDQV